MIKANDLRIGNLFHIITRNTEVHMPAVIPIEIKAIDQFKVKVRFTETDIEKKLDLRDLSPIPLTTEILQNIKFDLTGVQIVQKEMYFSIQANQWIMDEENEIASCKYLHELQNIAYALSKKDLNINESAIQLRNK